MQKKIKKAIRHFECVKNDAVAVLDSGFGTHPGESDTVYRNRKMYAELAIYALEKQMPRKPIDKCMFKECPNCKNVEILNCIYCSDCGQKLDWSDKNE